MSAGVYRREVNAMAKHRRKPGDGNNLTGYVIIGVMVAGEVVDTLSAAVDVFMKLAGF